MAFSCPFLVFAIRTAIHKKGAHRGYSFWLNSGEKPGTCDHSLVVQIVFHQQSTHSQSESKWFISTKIKHIRATTKEEKKNKAEENAD